MKLHILAMGAHPDDIELGAAGTLIKHVRKGQKVGIVDLTQGELGSRGTIETRYAEAKAAAEVMGLAIRENLKLRDGFFTNDEASRLELIRIIRKYRPEIVIGNAPEDRHPDHGRGCRLIADACFYSGLVKIATYDVDGEPQQAWRPKKVLHYIQDRHLKPNVIIDISDTIAAKMEAIRCYQTQFFSGEGHPDQEPVTYISRPGFLEAIRAKAKVWGHAIGADYAEGFILEGDYGLNDLDDIYLPKMS